VLALVLTVLAIWGCGTKGYTDPASGVVTTKTASALIEPETLKEWMDAGLVNKDGGSDRVVILEVNGSNLTNYTAEHIPGAIGVTRTAELSTSRVEGPALTGEMVADGKMMDALIQRAGIDANTTIVFTTSAAELDGNQHWNMTRGYATFRYWGFPKERLKVLDGGNKAWKAASLPTTKIVPTVKTSSYGVAPYGTNRVRDDVRASLSDMIKAVKAGTAQNDFIDGRSDGVPTSTTDLIDGTKWVVFEGQMQGGRGYAYGNLIDAATRKFKPAADVATGLNLQKPNNYVLCRAGNIASVLFFAIDGYAYYDESKKAVWYDGSWGQWGLMSTTATAKGGKLPADSAWATDTLTTAPTYNQDASRALVDLTLQLDGGVSHANADANQIEAADKAYRSPVSSGSSSGGGSAGGGGC